MPDDDAIWDAYLSLVGVILRVGLAAPSYFLSANGKFWCALSGLDPEAMYKIAIRGTPLETKGGVST